MRCIGIERRGLSYWLNSHSLYIGNDIMDLSFCTRSLLRVTVANQLAGWIEIMVGEEKLP
jgi:hypothetical protein